jgi:hypothetical protein
LLIVDCCCLAFYDEKGMIKKGMMPGWWVDGALTRYGVSGGTLVQNWLARRFFVGGKHISRFGQGPNLPLDKEMMVKLLQKLR